ncbi:MAG: polysaccharide deacetylase, partial [Caulobacteraceae bacterium]
DGRPIRWEPEPPAWIVAVNKAPASELQAIASAP